MNNKMHVNGVANPDHYFKVTTAQGGGTKHFVVNNTNTDILELKNTLAGYPELILRENNGTLRTLISTRDDSYITWSGNVGNFGIGTTTPTEKLEVVGSIKTSVGYKVGAATGFTGTGAYTNFTIVGGIITAASL